MSLIGKKVLIYKGRQKGVEGYVVYECHHAVTIKACGFFGDYGYYGHYYERRDNICVSNT